MKQFRYKAHDTAGAKVKGNIQAENEQKAGQLLVEKGLIPDEIIDTAQKGVFSDFTHRITGKDKIVFSRQLATLVGAGLPLATSLRTVAEQTANPKMRAVVEDILAGVEGGKNLVESFGKHPDVFNKVYLAIIQAGEMSGTLDESLKRIAYQQEKDAAMMSKIRGAMVYPAIVLVVILVVVAFMLFTVVPQVEQLYEDLGEELPFLTQLMVGVADFLGKFWWAVLIVVGLVIYFVRMYFKTEGGTKAKDQMKLNVPMFKGLFQKLYMARFARTSQILLSTGVAMLDTMHLSGDSINNSVVKNSIDEAADKVQSGKPLSEALMGRDYILPFLPQMISIGEQSGRIDEMLGKVAQVYEDELDEQIKALSTMIEPILMVFLAVVAGGMIGAVLFPIYALVSKF